MFVVANRVPVNPAHADTFESMFRATLGRTTNVPGFIKTQVLRPVEAGTYVVLTYWKDRASFEGWMQSESFQRAHARSGPEGMVSGPSALEMHEVALSTDPSEAG